MNNKLVVKFDYVSVTFPLVVLPDDNEQFIIAEVLKMISVYLNIQEIEIRKENYATNRFRYQYYLGEYITLRLAGPINDLGYKTCQLEMKGEGCREFERRNLDKSWKDLFQYLEKLNGNFKRIDIAIDDFEGETINMEWLFKKITKKNYTSIFKTPARIVGTFETGMSITMGSHTSSTELCIYDKLLEQMSKKKECLNDFWIRYEMRFRGEKANAIVYNLLKNFQDSNEEISGFALTDFACMMLRETIEIKEDNNYCRSHQKDACIDKKWKKFLDYVYIASYYPPQTRRLSYESSLDYIMPKASLMLLFGLIRGGLKIETWFYDIAKAVYRYTSDLKKAQIKRLNSFLLEVGNKPVDENTIGNIRNNLFIAIEEMEMPF